MWTFIAIYLVSSLLLLIYDLNLYFDKDGHCAVYLIENVIADNFVWTVGRILSYYIRSGVCFWAFYRSSYSEF